MTVPGPLGESPRELNMIIGGSWCGCDVLEKFYM
jgi:hypothetical protein